MHKNLTSGQISQWDLEWPCKKSPGQQYFSNLPQEKQQRIVDHTHNISSKQEMRNFVDHLADWAMAEGPAMPDHILFFINLYFLQIQQF